MPPRHAAGRRGSGRPRVHAPLVSCNAVAHSMQRVVLSMVRQTLASATQMGELHLMVSSCSLFVFCRCLFLPSLCGHARLIQVLQVVTPIIARRFCYDVLDHAEWAASMKVRIAPPSPCLCTVPSSFPVATPAGPVAFICPYGCTDRQTAGWGICYQQQGRWRAHPIPPRLSWVVSALQTILPLFLVDSVKNFNVFDNYMSADATVAIARGETTSKRLRSCPRACVPCGLRALD